MKRKRGLKKKKKKAGWWQNLQVVPILTYLWNINLSPIPIAGEEAVLDRTENFSKAMERGGWGGSMLDRSIQRGSERKQLAACPWSCGHYAPSYIHYIYIYICILYFPEARGLEQTRCEVIQRSEAPGSWLTGELLATCNINKSKVRDLYSFVYCGVRVRSCKWWRIRTSKALINQRAFTLMWRRNQPC